MRLRSESFQAILRQEIGWFDEERNSSGSLVARLADDASKIRGATGVRVGTLLESIFGMLVAIIIAFVYSWVLTLLILGVVPIILITGGLQGKFLAGYTAENKRSLENSGKVRGQYFIPVLFKSRCTLDPLLRSVAKRLIHIVCFI